MSCNETNVDDNGDYEEIEDPQERKKRDDDDGNEDDGNEDDGNEDDGNEDDGIEEDGNEGSQGCCRRNSTNTTTDRLTSTSMTPVPNVTFTSTSGMMTRNFPTNSTAPPSMTPYSNSSVHKRNVTTEPSRNLGETHSPHRAATLTVVLPSLAAIFVLLMFICFLALCKKTSRRKKPKGNSLKLQKGEAKQELGHSKGKLKDPYPIESPAAPHNLYTDPNRDGKKGDVLALNKEKPKDPYPIVSANTSSSHYTDVKSRGKKKGLAIKDITNVEAQYAEVDECRQPVSTSPSQKGKVAPAVHYKVSAQDNHGYEEAIVGKEQCSDEYEEAKVKSAGHGYDDAKGKETKDNDGYETAKISGPFYHTLDPEAPSDSSYMSLPKNKVDGGYDTLDRQQKHSSESKSQPPSGYDSTERIGKGDVTFAGSNENDNDYSTASRSTADSSQYDKLDRTKRSYEVDGISPNEYKTLQPQEKK